MTLPIEYLSELHAIEVVVYAKRADQKAFERNEKGI